MLRVLFFGRIREELDCAQLTLEDVADGLDLDGLLELLVSTHGQCWHAVLSQENVIRAVNQQVVTENQLLLAGDEVAFFPPVTGG